MNTVFVCEGDAATMLSLPLRSLQGLRKRGQGPAHTKIGRSYFYTETAITEWAAHRTAAGSAWRVARQTGLIREFFPGAGSDEDGALDLEVNGLLAMNVHEDGQSYISFTGEDGTVLAFDCWGFKRDKAAIWSTGDVTIYRIGGGDDANR